MKFNSKQLQLGKFKNLNSRNYINLTNSYNFHLTVANKGIVKVIKWTETVLKATISSCQTPSAVNRCTKSKINSNRRFCLFAVNLERDVTCSWHQLSLHLKLLNGFSDRLLKKSNHLLRTFALNNCASRYDHVGTSLDARTHKRQKILMYKAQYRYYLSLMHGTDLNQTMQGFKPVQHKLRCIQIHLLTKTVVELQVQG